MDEFKTKVIFRVWKDGQVIALFPEILADHNMNMMSYMRVGQHSAAYYGLVLNHTKPATKEQYKPLYDELASIGYNLQVVKRQTHKMRDIMYGEFLKAYRS